MANSYTSSLRNSSMSGKTFSGFGNLLKLLPTGTVFIFEFLNPVLSNEGQCRLVNNVLTSILIALCGVFCAFSCFTDSYRSSDGSVYYGFVTVNGLWLFSGSDSGSVDLSSYKLRIGDFVHAFFAVIVFAVLALLDSNTVRCFYPSFELNERTLLVSLPPVIGMIAGTVFMAFPNTRRGLGYPPTD